LFPNPPKLFPSTFFRYFFGKLKPPIFFSLRFDLVVSRIRSHQHSPEISAEIFPVGCCFFLQAFYAMVKGKCNVWDHFDALDDQGNLLGMKEKKARFARCKHCPDFKQVTNATLMAHHLKKVHRSRRRFAKPTSQTFPGPFRLRFPRNGSSRRELPTCCRSIRTSPHNHSKNRRQLMFSLIETLPIAFVWFCVPSSPFWK